MKAMMAVHLFVDASGAHDGDATLRAAHRVLDPDEITRLDAFAFDVDRLRYAAAHLLLRRALTQLHPHREPSAWRFAIGRHGRPMLHASHHEDVTFSLTHTEGCCACVIASRSLEVGVDAESVVPPAPLELARSKFAVGEREQLERLDGAARARAFYELWTLKEAYLKARGLGLAVPLDQVAILRDAPPRVVLAPALHDDAGRWSFSLLRRDHVVLAIAIGRPSAASMPPPLVEHG